MMLVWGNVEQKDWISIGYTRKVEATHKGCMKRHANTRYISAWGFMHGNVELGT